MSALKITVIAGSLLFAIYAAAFTNLEVASNLEYKPAAQASGSSLVAFSTPKNHLLAGRARIGNNSSSFFRTINVQENAKTTNQSKQKPAASDQKQENQKERKQEPMGEDKMQFGNFSVSLTVKDIKASKAFYEKLDFQHVGGSLEQNYVIMQNGTTNIGLFQGMFEKNILTFNPGWNHKTETLEKFQDVRDLQATIKERGITPVTEADAATAGPTSFVIVDPDGNSILVDQHVPKPE
jgi:predicted enzyme related to lactoylglutathione lyase